MPINITPPQYTISCPIPDNLTPLSPNGFMLSIAKLPEVNFFCQQVDLPQVDLGNIEQMTPLSIVQIPGEMLSFGELHVDRKSTRLNSSHIPLSRMPSSA